MLLRLGLIISLFSILQFQSNAAVLSIDLGSEWLKVAVVNLKPGQTPISVAINEMSKRKSPNLVAFHLGDRLIGEEAAGLVARYPEKVYGHLRDLIGKPYAYAKRKLDSLYLPYDVVEDSRGVVAFKVDDGTVYSVEEMVAMIFRYAMNLAEFHSRVVIKDAVITVPSYFGQAERKGVLQAAELAGMNVLSLINEHSGAALQYGIDKNFANDSRYVVFYDMGSSNTYAALVYFSAYNAKEYGKSVSINQFQVIDVRWSFELGGQDLELRLVEYFADEFNKQVGGGFDVRKYPKAMAKLKKQVKRTKEILSANTAAPISVESLYDDRDFRSTITREKFEELCEEVWEKSLLPLKDVLKHSELKAEEIYAVELIGGATRVPKLQAKIQEFLGRKELDKHLDADEATVLGAALHAANISDGIKLNRKLGMVDGATYGYAMQLHSSELGKDESTKQVIIQRMKKVPSKIFRSIVHNKDFEVSLAYESEELLPPAVSSPLYAQYAVSGLAGASEKYSSRNLSAPIKANLHFSLSRSGVFTLARVEAVIEISEWVEVPKKNMTVENITLSANPTDGPTDSAEENNTDANTDNGDKEAPNSAAKEDKKVESVEKKLKRRTFRVPLKVIEKTTGPVISLSKESLTEGKRKLEELDRKDSQRRRTAELKNNLEGYVYSTREKIESSEEVEKVSTSEERQSFTQTLDEVQEWLYMDGEDASANEFQERLDVLKSIGDPIFLRLKELSARPAAVEAGRNYLAELKQIVRGWETRKPWIPKDRIDEILSTSEKFKKWLDKEAAEQNKTPVYAPPVFISDEVYDKLFDLQSKVTSINRIPKPKPKIEKPVENETDAPKTDKTSDSSSNNDKDASSVPTESSNSGASDDLNNEGHEEL